MLDQPLFRLTEEDEIREILAAHPWATLVSATTDGLQVSHCPILLAGETGTAVVGHLARSDGKVHELGQHDVVLIVQGPHGYLSPSWYGEEPHVPTWNFVVVHLYGRPEVLDGHATYDVLSRTVDHLEADFDDPWTLDRVAPYAASIAPSTVGFRMTPTRVVAKAKLSQEESLDLVARSVGALRADQPPSRVGISRRPPARIEEAATADRHL